MKRRVSLRGSYQKKLKKRKELWKSKGLKRKKPMRRVSRKQRSRLSEYYPIQKEFLSRPENKYCLICKVRKGLGERIRIHQATEVHHCAYRHGNLLFDTSYFAPSCKHCRSWPHENVLLAEKYGLIVRINFNEKNKP